MDTTVLNRSQRPYALEAGLHLSPCGHYSSHELRSSLALARQRVLTAFKERDHESQTQNSEMARALGSELVRRIRAALRDRPLRYPS